MISRTAKPLIVMVMISCVFTLSEARDVAFNRKNLMAKSWMLDNVQLDSQKLRHDTKDVPYFSMIELRQSGQIHFFSALTNCKTGRWQLQGKTVMLSLTAKDDATFKKTTLKFTRNYMGTRESHFHKGKFLQQLILEGKYKNTPIKYTFTEFEGMGGS